MYEVRVIRVPILLSRPLVEDGNTDDTDFVHGFTRILDVKSTDKGVLVPRMTTAQFTASDGTAGDWFGYSVALSVDYAIVSTYRKTVGSNAEQGKAYFFAK